MSQVLTLPSAIHLAALLPTIAIGVIQLAAPKGMRLHKILGWIWIVSMLVAVLSSFWIMELRKGAGWSVIQLLSAWTLICLSLAIWFIRRGNVRAHMGFMISTLLGLAGAGLGALAPGRFLAKFLF